MKIHVKKICMIITLAFAVISAALIAGIFNAAAAEPITGKRLLPVSELETVKLINPQGVSYSDDNYAVIHNGNHIMTRINGEIKDVELKNDQFGNLTIPTQIKFFGERVFFVCDNRICELKETADGEYTALKDSENEDVRCTSYDISGNTLVANTTGSNVKVYSLTQNKITLVTQKTNPNVDENKPITLNGKSIFFISSKPNYYPSSYDFALTETKELCKTSVNAGSMIANDEYLYYAESGYIFRTPVDGGEPVNITPSADVFDLGKIISPTGLCFKGENLLISDASLNAVQEFRISDGKLEFTGFAIAGGKTAYNRVGTVKDMDKYGNRVAALSDEKLTVITVTEEFDGYDRSFFENLFVGERIECFALGKNTVAAAQSNRVVIKTLGFSDLAEEIEFGSVTEEVKDLYYQSGKYYALTFNGLKYAYYTFTEAGGEPEKLGETIDSAACISADVFGNVTLSDASEGFIKTAHDLKRAFGLKSDGKLYYKSDDGTWQETGLEGVTAFALNFDKKEVYYSTDQAEYLYETAELGNLAVSSVKTPSDYALSGKTATAAGDYYKIIKIKDGEKNVNLYGYATSGSSVEFTDFAEKEDEYVYVAKDEPTGLYFLAGKNGTVLAHDVQTTTENRAFTPASKNIYVTTGVHAYYYPIITKNNIYALNDGTTSVIFKKNVRLTAEKRITVLGKDFYYAETSFPTGETIKFFIPADFTVDELSADRKYAEYTIEKVKKTAVFKDAALSEELAILEKNSPIRLISTEKGICKIAFLNDGEWTEGYIKASAVTDESSIAVRNVLIVLAAIACACGSATYFILRKRTQSD